MKTKFSFKEDEENVYWHVVQENIHALMDTRIACKKKDMLLINYEAPDGSKRHNRLWNGGTGYGVIRLYERERRELVLINEIEATHVGCEYGEYGAETMESSTRCRLTPKTLWPMTSYGSSLLNYVRNDGVHSYE